MNTDQTVQLINLLSKKRAESGLSVAEVARRSNVDVAAVWRIEQGMIANPKAEVLKAIGTALGIPSIDLFIVVGLIEDDELPTLPVYLRTMYPGLPDEAVQAIESQTAAVAKKFGVNVKNGHPHLPTAKES